MCHLVNMYIRRTQIQKKKEGGFYYTYRIVESLRTGKQVRQITLLNLGTDFILVKEKWPILTKRIEELLAGQSSILEIDCDIDVLARNFAEKIIIKQQDKNDDNTGKRETDYRSIDIDSLEMIESEIIGVIELVQELYSAFGFKDYHIELSTMPEKHIGSDEIWETATESLRGALVAKGLDFQVNEGDGAFYGPKIDVKIKDALGRQWQLSTIQFDFNLPERFNLSYIGEDGKEHQPYMVHRALLGSLERFFGILIEHYAGAFPVWLAPEQVRVLPLTENQIEYSKLVLKTLQENDIRASMDEKSEKVGAKIRRARGEMIPYMLILGPKEEEAGAVAVRERLAGDVGAVGIDEFVERIKKENEPGQA